MIRKSDIVILLTCVLFISGCKTTNKIDDNDSYPVKINKTGKARIVDPLYETGEIIIADYDVVLEYNADPTGVADSSKAFQNALDDCYANGGGTVWVPSGTYKISRSIIVRPFCTIRGDWQDPDRGTGYGTVIRAEVPSGDTPLFLIGGSAGVFGMTVFYPRQSASEPVPYGWTFEIRGNGDPLGTGFNFHASTVKNVTLINSYKGLGINAIPYETAIHELSRVENIKGTALLQGIEAFNCADVGMWRDISFNNRYWAEAPREFNPPERSILDQWTRSNGTAMTLGDLEWDSFYNINISDYHRGIHLVNRKRIGVAGMFVYTRIENSDFGVLADPISIDSRDEKWGLSFFKSSIQGSAMAIQNDSWGYIHIDDSIIDGVIGTVAESASKTPRTNVGDSQSGFHTYNEIESQPTVTRAVLYDVSKKPYRAPWSIGSVPERDATPAIQKALDDAGQDGGGVVYLPAGWYRIDTHLTIPENVELRGASSIMNRSQSGLSHGTVLFAYKGAGTADSDSTEACVSIEGDGSGIKGLRIFYPENPFTEIDSFKSFPWAIRINGAEDAYVENVAIENAYRGLISEEGSDRHYIKNVVGAATHGFIKIKASSAGWIEDCHSNPNFWPRTGYGITPWMREGTGNEFWDGLVPVRRENCILISIENAQNENLMNNFGYAVLHGVEATDSRVNIFNMGTDNLGGYTVLAKGDSDVRVLNSMRWNGEENVSGAVENINPMHLR